MKITLVGNRTTEHLHVPGSSGVTEREGGPISVAEKVLSGFADIDVSTITSGELSVVDIALEDGGATNVVNSNAVKVRGIQDANAFLIYPLVASDFTFDQLELLSGKIAVCATGLSKVLNSKEPVDIKFNQMFLPLVDAMIMPWSERKLFPEDMLKELKKDRILILTKGANGADVYDHGRKHIVAPADDLPSTLALYQDACFLATFMAHHLRGSQSELAANLAAEALADRLKDPEAIPIPNKSRSTPYAGPTHPDEFDLEPPQQSLL